jgi:hypothetical protein
MTADRRLSQNVVNRVFARRLGPLDESPPKTHFFDFIRFDAVLGNVLNAILRPDELIDRHLAILGEEIKARKCVRLTACG